MGAWVKADPIGTGLYKILGHDDGNWDRTIGLDDRQSGGFRWTAFHGGGTISNTPTPAFNQWTFIAATYDNAAATMTLYIDLNASTTGDALVATTSPTTFGPGQASVAIGNLRPDNFAEPFTGLMDNVFFFNDTLTLAEITAIRNSGSGFFLDNALAMASSESAVLGDRPQLSLVFTTPSTPLLPGDFDGDGLVGVADLGILQAHLGLSGGATSATGDMNGDGVVNRADAAAFAAQFGKSVAPGPSPAAAAAVFAARRDAAGPTRRDSEIPTPNPLRALAHRRLDRLGNAASHDAVWSELQDSDQESRSRRDAAARLRLRSRLS
jgi:hypothetical protein